LLQVEQLEGRVVPSTIILGPSKDNTLYQSPAGNISNGAGSYFIAGRDGLMGGGAIRRGVIAFDIAGNIPAGATINSVSLRLNMDQTRGGTAAVRLARLTADWGEGTSNADGSPGQGTLATTNDATWVYRFFNTTATWTNPGGDFVSTVSAFTFVGGFGFYTWGSTTQMVADVQGWLNTPSSNFGWILLGDESAIQTAKRFDSKENATAANRPMLTIDYTSTSTASTLQVAGFPSPITAGMAGTVTVTAKDASGNIATDYRGTVRLTSSDPQFMPFNYVFTATDAGVHPFSLTLKTAGPQSITATDIAVSSITGSQTGITVTPAAADHLVFNQQPSNTVAGQSINPALKVAIADQFGNVLTGDNTDTVTVAIGTNPGGGTLSGTLTVTVSGGVATFGDLSIDKAGSGYTLAASSAGLTGATSNGFAITPAAADHLVFLQQPTNTAAGQTITPAVQVAVVDQFGNVVTSDNSDTVTVAICNNPSGGTLSGTLTLTVSNGIASFGDLSIDLVGDGYTLHVTASGLTAADSNAFSITM
jgi:hypothetical protein